MRVSARITYRYVGMHDHAQQLNNNMTMRNNFTTKVINGIMAEVGNILKVTTHTKEVGEQETTSTE